MTSQEVNSLNEIVSRFRATDVSNQVAIDLNITDLSSLNAGDKSIATILKYVYSITDSIEYICASPDIYEITPRVFVHQGTQVDLLAYYNSLWAYVEQKNYLDLNTNTTILASCLFVNGLWFRVAEERDLTSVIQDFKNRSSEAQNLLGETKKINKSIKTIYEEIENIKTDMINFLNAKKSEFATTQEYVSQSQKRNEEIGGLLVQATKSNSDINNVFSNLEKEFLRIQQESSDKISSLNETYNNYILSLQKLTDKLNQEDDRSKKLSISVSESKEILDNFKDKEEYLNRILGNAASVSLYNTFNDRSNQLTNSLWLWGILSVVSVIILGALVYMLILHATASKLNPYDWNVILGMTFRSTPAIVFVYFSISQYIKERTYKEEYAFKSAVALTINSYADMIEDDDIRKKFRLRATMLVYRPPVFHRGNFFFTKRQADKLAKESKDLLLELVKSLKSTK